MKSGLNPRFEKYAAGFSKIYKEYFGTKPTMKVLVFNGWLGIKDKNILNFRKMGELHARFLVEEKQKLEYMEFDHNGLHFECYKGGMIVTRNGKQVVQCIDVFRKFVPPKEDIIRFWKTLSKMIKE